MLTKKLLPVFLAGWVVLSLVPAAVAQGGGDEPVYLNPHEPVERRIDDLMSRMTLKEKVGQLNLPCVYVEELGKDIPSKMAACRRFAAGTYTQEIGPGCGFFTLANEILVEGARQQAEYFNELQRIARTETRLKIPLLEDEEGTHGAMFPGGTVFPEGLTIGSTFDMNLVKSIYAAAAAEARAVGIICFPRWCSRSTAIRVWAETRRHTPKILTCICASRKALSRVRKARISLPRTR